MQGAQDGQATRSELVQQIVDGVRTASEMDDHAQANTNAQPSDSDSDSVSLSSRSPIMYQPITNLALICRYLTPKELLAFDKTCRLLSVAASHPLTFQQETDIGVAHDLYHCRSYARGPVGIFGADWTKLRSALQSRLFSHFKILKLNYVNLWPARSYHCDDSDDEWREIELQEEIHTTIVDWLKCLSEEATTPIKALTIQTECAFYSELKSQIPDLNSQELLAADPVLRGWCESKSMQFLTLLHLVQLDKCLITVLAYLPPSVKILHLTLNDYGEGVEPGIKEIYESLGSRHCLTTLIFDAANEPRSFTSHTDLISLAKLSHHPTIESIHWCFPLDLVELFHSNSQLFQLWPNELEMTIPHLLTISLGFPWPIWDGSTFEKLSIFTDLARLIFVTSPFFSPAFVGIQWPDQIRQSLSELRFSSKVGQSLINCLRAAGLVQIRLLVFDEKLEGTLAPWLISLPNLTSLTVQKLEHIYEPDANKSIEVTAQVLIKALPALIELRLLHRLCSTSRYPSPEQCLSRLPKLERIKWSRHGWIPTSQIPAQLLTDLQMQHEDEKFTKEYHKAQLEYARQQWTKRESTPNVLALGNPLLLLVKPRAAAAATTPTPIEHATPTRATLFTSKKKVSGGRKSTTKGAGNHIPPDMTPTTTTTTFGADFSNNFPLSSQTFQTDMGMNHLSITTPFTFTLPTVMSTAANSSTTENPFILFPPTTPMTPPPSVDPFSLSSA